MLQILLAFRSLSPQHTLSKRDNLYCRVGEFEKESGEGGGGYIRVMRSIRVWLPMTPAGRTKVEYRKYVLAHK